MRVSLGKHNIGFIVTTPPVFFFFARNVACIVLAFLVSRLLRGCKTS